MEKKINKNLLTPVTDSKKRRTDVKATTPFTIPPSPCMKQLGYGTDSVDNFLSDSSFLDPEEPITVFVNVIFSVNVYLYERFSPIRGCYKSPWAVKKINSKLTGLHSECTDRLELETEVLKRLSHPNIIGYRSSTKSEDGSLCLLMESGEQSLADIIETQAENELGPFSVEKILKVSKSIASALDYLHHDMHLLHGDLKSANVLIKGDFENIKLCDFGVTLKLDENLVVDAQKEFYVGTECWSAPEAIIGDTITNKTDIFSFGLIIWEMMSLSVPHLDKLDEISFAENVNTETVEELEKKREEEYQKALGTRPVLPTDIAQNDSYKKIVELFCICTEIDQNKRPSAKQILSLYLP